MDMFLDQSARRGVSALRVKKARKRIAKAVRRLRSASWGRHVHPVLQTGEILGSYPDPNYLAALEGAKEVSIHCIMMRERMEVYKAVSSDFRPGGELELAERILCAVYRDDNRARLLAKASHRFIADWLCQSYCDEYIRDWLGGGATRIYVTIESGTKCHTISIPIDRVATDLDELDRIEAAGENVPYRLQLRGGGVVNSLTSRVLAQGVSPGECALSEAIDEDSDGSEGDRDLRSHDCHQVPILERNGPNSEGDGSVHHP